MALIEGGVRVGGFISPTDSQDTYPVVDPVYGIGGFRVVETLVSKYSIPYARRRVGMIVRIQSNRNDGVREDYRLTSLGTEGQNTDESNWELLNLNYELPVATEQTLGGVKGDGITTEIEEDGTISVLPLQGELEQWKTSGTGSNNSGKYTKVFSVTIEEQYDFCSAHLMAISGGHGLDESDSQVINFSVKKQSEMPVDISDSADVIVNLTVTSTGNNNNVEYYYVSRNVLPGINTPRVVVVDVYLKMNRTYDETKFILLQEHLTDNATFTHFSNQNFFDSIASGSAQVETIFLSDVKSKANDAYNHSQVATGNPHSVKYSELTQRPLKDDGVASPSAYIGAEKVEVNSSDEPNVGDLGMIKLDSYSGRYYQFNTDYDSDLKKYFYIDSSSMVLGAFSVIRLKANQSNSKEPYVFLSADDALEAFNTAGAVIVNPLKKVVGHDYDDTIDMLLVVQTLPGVDDDNNSVTAEYFFLRDDNLN